MNYTLFIFPIGTPAVSTTGAPYCPLPKDLSRRGNSTGAHINPLLYTTEICQSQMLHYSGYYQCVNMHILPGEPNKGS